MHEFSLAYSLLDQVSEIAVDQNLDHVDEVILETGILREVVPDIMRLAFQEAAQGTVAAGAILTITEVGALAKCRICTERFEPKRDDYSCPRCLIADVDVIQGNDIILKSIAGGQSAAALA